jgi:hypothetical protein
MIALYSKLLTARRAVQTTPYAMKKIFAIIRLLSKHVKFTVFDRTGRPVQAGTITFSELITIMRKKEYKGYSVSLTIELVI